ncbi:hypothetical protein SAMN04488102_101339 [Alkalibacterium subtropicum]|uniref:Uncharacterized protein n=2 Tax=Alkalibacterium subtropicum TaxID=753702 RepID=A0A1I1ESW9_9LACT|nr:hypothetical protein SAMN04488102_101339 [Alkalibacterium subtropicum]
MKESDRDEYMLQTIGEMEEIAEKEGHLKIAECFVWVNQLYNRLDEAQARIEELKEDREYYEERCRDEGIY